MMNNDELFAAITDAFDRKVEEVKRHTGALVEDLRGDVKAIAEGHDILFNKMDNLEQRFDGLERRFDGLEQRFDGLEQRFDGLEGKVDGLERKFDGLEGKVDGLDKRVGRLEKNMNIIKDYVIGVDAKLNEHEIILKRVR